VPYTCQH